MWFVSIFSEKILGIKVLGIVLSISCLLNVSSFEVVLGLLVKLLAASLLYFICLRPCFIFPGSGSLVDRSLSLVSVVAALTVLLVRCYPLVEKVF